MEYIKRVHELMGTPFLLIYFALIIGLIYFLMFSLPQAFESKDWPETQAIVTNSEIKRLAPKKGSAPKYHPVIEYQYSVSGIQYQSNRINIHDHYTTGSKRAQEITTLYPVDSTVRIYYNPTRPEQAVLNNGVRQGQFITIVFFILGLSLMSFIVYTKLQT